MILHHFILMILHHLIFVIFVIHIFLSQVLSTTNILVVGGWDHQNKLNDVESITIQNSKVIDNKCDRVSTYPFAVNSIAGITLDSQIIICGGWSGKKESSCYILYKNTTKWIPISNMQEERARFGLAVTKKGVIAVGGYDNKASAEIYQNNRWNPIKNIPVGIEYHCMVSIDNDQVIAIAGFQNKKALRDFREFNPNPSSHTWIYSSSSNQWKQGPFIITPRHSHSCTSIQNGQEEYDLIIIAGGSSSASNALAFASNAQAIDSVEILNLSQNKVQTIRNLPKAVYGAAMVRDNNDESPFVAYLLGGYDGNDRFSTIYGLRNNLQEWKVLGHMEKKKNGFVALSISPNFLPGCNIKKDCEWNDFGAWSACSKTCGNGQQISRRAIKQHAEYGGTHCSGNPSKTRTCNEKPCPVNCRWSTWQRWEECNVECGNGVQIRSRIIARSAQRGGKQCVEHERESKPCNNGPCQVPVDCTWSSFNNWSPCSSSCGDGVKTSTRRFVQQSANGGKLCTGSSTKTEKCNNGPCEEIIAPSICKDHSDCKDVKPDVCQRFSFIKGRCPVACGLCTCQDTGDCKGITLPTCRLFPQLKESCQKTCGICEDRTDTFEIPKGSSGKENEEATWLNMHCGSINKRPDVKSTTTTEVPYLPQQIIGSDTRAQLTPWIASIGTYNEASTRWSHFCGGVIITALHLLTAAHCVDADFPSLPQEIKHEGVKDAARIRLGSSQTPFDLKLEYQEIEGMRNFTIKEFIIHPRYSTTKAEFDIAVITLSDDITWSETIFPICLPSTEDTSLPLNFFAGDIATVSGWGKTEVVQSVDDLPTLLHEAQIEVQNQGFCNERYSFSNNDGIFASKITAAISRLIPERKIPSSVLCASSSRGDPKGSCQGDSGGPLTISRWSKERKEKVYTLLGTVVATPGLCGNTYFPTLFTRIRDCEILKFINSVTKITNTC